MRLVIHLAAIGFFVIAPLHALFGWLLYAPFIIAFQGWLCWQLLEVDPDRFPPGDP